MVEERTCPICNNLFTVPITRKNQKYCSRDCAVIGRKLSNEEKSAKRVNVFIENIADLPIYDVLEGKLETATNNRMTVTGARMWEGKKFLIIVTD